jgi:hypothetical protein
MAPAANADETAKGAERTRRRRMKTSEPAAPGRRFPVPSDAGIDRHRRLELEAGQ